jgi:serine/threonine-protein kinase
MRSIGLGFAIAVLGIAMIAPLASARADCVSDCEAATYCDSEMHASGECAEKLNACYLSECSKPKTLYGAIAYDSESGSVGYSYDFPDVPRAEEKALAACKATGTDCRVMVDFWNTCAAIATAGQTAAYGLGKSQQLAESEAIAACTKDGGSGCVVQAWSCTNNNN